MVKPIIEPSELVDLAAKEKIVVIDASGSPGARDRYEARHLSGALFLDLENDLADIKADGADGGRHPLPSPGAFSKLISSLGIDDNTHVIVYDDKAGANAAARLWWMLKATGIKKVQVINGGMQAAVEAGFATSDATAEGAAASDFSFSKWQLPLADINEVATAAYNKDRLVIDVRDAYRYLGESEPIDLIAGHIPGAINVPFAENLENGKFKSPEELKAKYAALLEGKSPEQVIVHCGSGVTACHTLLAMEHAGIAMPSLYVGSWSEWSRRDLPMATTDRY